MFCGDSGFRPVDMKSSSDLSERKSDPERWFWEELPIESLNEWRDLFRNYQKQITGVLLKYAYKNDPFPPEFLLHQTVKFEDINQCNLALFPIDTLIDFSCQYSGFTTKSYSIKKGRFKNDPHVHKAPRFGYIQFQRGGQKQHPTQLQFNLQTAYFDKLPMQAII